MPGGYTSGGREGYQSVDEEAHAPLPPRSSRPPTAQGPPPAATGGQPVAPGAYQSL